MFAQLNPYPHYYCPDGVDKPAHCPHPHALRPLAGKCPDGGSGTVYAPEYTEASKPQWKKTAAGWWILMHGQRPQDLPRIGANPRIMRWHLVDGADSTQRWRVPVLLSLAEPGNEQSGYITAVDRVYVDGEWQAPAELASMQHRLLAVANHIALHDDLAERNAAITQLVTDILGVGHLVTIHEIACGGWLSELMQLRVLFAALDRLDLISQLSAAARGDLGAEVTHAG